MGHVIDVKPAGWTWGDQECLPKFVILQVSDMDVTTGQQYLAALRDSNNNVVGIRQWIFNFPAIPATPPHGAPPAMTQAIQVANNLAANGVSTIATADLTPMITQVTVSKIVTVKPSGGNYTSLNAALAGESTNLVTNTEQMMIAITPQQNAIINEANAFETKIGSVRANYGTADEFTSQYFYQVQNLPGVP